MIKGVVGLGEELEMADWLLALDFGTTATAAAVREGDGPVRVLVLGDGAMTVSSAVFAEGPGRLLVGADADNEAEYRLDAYEPTPKRRIGEESIRLGDWDFQPAELVGAVMAPVLAEAMRQHRDTVPSQIVLTYPVAWRSARRAILGDALAVVGAQLGLQLPHPTFVPEPVAAARWYAHDQMPEEGAYFAVYDLGGGTFDTTVLLSDGDGFEVVASGGIDPLGGFDFDAALFADVGQRHIALATPELWAALTDPGSADVEVSRQRRRLQQRVALLKTGLSTSPDKRIQLPGVDGPVVVTRGEYEALISGFVDATITELENTIADAGITLDQVTAIYRIGGASRTPLVGAALDRLRLPVEVLDQPKLVVAQGAATPRANRGATPALQVVSPRRHQPKVASPAKVAALTTPAAPAGRPAGDGVFGDSESGTRARKPETADPIGHQQAGGLTAGRQWGRPSMNRWRIGLRTSGVVLLAVTLITETNAAALAGQSSRVLIAAALIIGVVAGAIYSGRKYGWPVSLIVVGAALIADVVHGLVREQDFWFDIAGYAGLTLVLVTRAPRGPTPTEAARYWAAGALSIAAFVVGVHYYAATHATASGLYLRMLNETYWLAIAAGLGLLSMGCYLFYKCVVVQQIYSLAKTARDVSAVTVAVMLVAVLAQSLALAAGSQSAPATSHPVPGNSTAAAASPGSAGALPAFTPPAGLGEDCQYPATPQQSVKAVELPHTGKIPTLPASVAATMVTNDGNIGLQLDNAKAPCTVNNFASLAQRGFFNNTTCHRLTSGGLSILQCGDPSATGMGGPGYQFPNEYPTNQYASDSPELVQPVLYPRGTLAMANAGPGTNGSQFFLVYRDSELPPTYTVFGAIDNKGLATLDRIVANGISGGAVDGKPARQVLIESISLD